MPSPARSPGEWREGDYNRRRGRSRSPDYRLGGGSSVYLSGDGRDGRAIRDGRDGRRSPSPDRRRGSDRQDWSDRPDWRRESGGPPQPNRRQNYHDSRDPRVLSSKPFPPGARDRTDYYRRRSRSPPPPLRYDSPPPRPKSHSTPQRSRSPSLPPVPATARLPEVAVDLESFVGAFQQVLIGKSRNAIAQRAVDRLSKLRADPAELKEAQTSLETTQRFLRVRVGEMQEMFVQLLRRALPGTEVALPQDVSSLDIKRLRERIAALEEEHKTTEAQKAASPPPLPEGEPSTQPAPPSQTPPSQPPPPTEPFLTSQVPTPPKGQSSESLPTQAVPPDSAQTVEAVQPVQAAQLPVRPVLVLRPPGLSQPTSSNVKEGTKHTRARELLKAVLERLDAVEDTMKEAFLRMDDVEDQMADRDFDLSEQAKRWDVLLERRDRYRLLRGESVQKADTGADEAAGAMDVEAKSAAAEGEDTKAVGESDRAVASDVAGPPGLMSDQAAATVPAGPQLVQAVTAEEVNRLRLEMSLLQKEVKALRSSKQAPAVISIEALRDALSSDILAEMEKHIQDRVENSIQDRIQQAINQHVDGIPGSIEKLMQDKHNLLRKEVAEDVLVWLRQARTSAQQSGSGGGSGAYGGAGAGGGIHPAHLVPKSPLVGQVSPRLNHLPHPHPQPHPAQAPPQARQYASPALSTASAPAPYAPNAPSLNQQLQSPTWQQNEAQVPYPHGQLDARAQTQEQATQLAQALLDQKWREHQQNGGDQQQPQQMPMQVQLQHQQPPQHQQVHVPPLHPQQLQQQHPPHHTPQHSQPLFQPYQMQSQGGGGWSRHMQ